MHDHFCSHSNNHNLATSPSTITAATGAAPTIIYRWRCTTSISLLGFSGSARNPQQRCRTECSPHRPRVATPATWKVWRVGLAHPKVTGRTKTAAGKLSSQLDEQKRKTQSQHLAEAATGKEAANGGSRIRWCGTDLCARVQSETQIYLCARVQSETQIYLCALGAPQPREDVPLDVSHKSFPSHGGDFDMAAMLAMECHGVDGAGWVNSVSSRGRWG
ncbi:hypothetical protein EDC01DRAFT_263336 [Geopyxis carbonaria]|nr:hypothetical protein EDC01DRAFT_263336 [Geopyxis carbonaria]